MSNLILAVLFLVFSKNVNPGEATGCLNFVGDVHFLLNTTQNFDIESINGEKDFVARFAESFQIGSNNVQIGVTLFSSQIHHQFDMGLHLNLTSMLEAIEYIPNRLGSSQTDNALEWVFKHAFSKDAGNRESVPNILIVLTDVYAVAEIQRLASGLQGHDISVFVIGIGLVPDLSELAQIVTHQQGISPVSASGTLWDLQIKLQDSVCKEELSSNLTPSIDNLSAPRNGVVHTVRKTIINTD
ncbi:collagen alpha-1(XII) chain-like [Mytilus trossulus]|uniref:collagen alpha-1(XII) chain-like n=1 Tax=Mytilus trossulus TaxID=6551 RepID=UPI0030060A83